MRIDNCSSVLTIWPGQYFAWISGRRDLCSSKVPDILIIIKQAKDEPVHLSGMGKVPVVIFKGSFKFTIFIKSIKILLDSFGFLLSGNFT